MPYTTKCPRYYNDQHLQGPYVCDLCNNTGVVKAYRAQLTQWDASELGWPAINTWPQYGEAGHCRCCGTPLTGRRKTRCGDRRCNTLIWKRLYERVHWMKRHIIVRDGCVCRACGEVFESPLVEGGPVYPEPHALELDHIVPLSDGGSEMPENLQLLCPSCHASKTAREARERAVRKGEYGG